MKKIREIINNFACDYHPCWHEKDYVFRSIEEGDFDALEKDLQELMTEAVNRAYDNAKRKIRRENLLKRREK